MSEWSYRMDFGVARPPHGAAMSIIAPMPTDHCGACGRFTGEKGHRCRFRYSMLRVRSRRNSATCWRDLIWDKPEDCWIDGHSPFGRIYLKVPLDFGDGDTGESRVHPARYIYDFVETAMLHEGEWYWIVRRVT